MPGTPCSVGELLEIEYKRSQTRSPNGLESSPEHKRPDIGTKPGTEQFLWSEEGRLRPVRVGQTSHLK